MTFGEPRHSFGELKLNLGPPKDLAPEIFSEEEKKKKSRENDSKNYVDELLIDEPRRMVSSGKTTEYVHQWTSVN